LAYIRRRTGTRREDVRAAPKQACEHRDTLLRAGHLRTARLALELRNRRAGLCALAIERGQPVACVSQLLIECAHTGRQQSHRPSGPLATIAVMDDADLTALRIPAALRGRAREILAICDQACTRQLDDEYAHVCRQLVGRLARKRPSPLMRGDTRIWAAGAIYAVGQVNFLFDRSQQPHMTADQLAACLGVVKTTMANKAALINRTLNIGIFEPGLTTTAMLEQHPLAWLVEVDGLILDARMLPAELQDEAGRRGLIPDLEQHRAA
jgi:hypothetical protein